MKKYKAVFEAPATVRMEFDVMAENQQDALVASHDVLAQVGMAAAKVKEVQGEPANVALEPVAAKDSSWGIESYRVAFYRALQSTTPDISIVCAERGIALATAATVKDEASLFARATVEDAQNVKIASYSAEFGGWEIHLLSKEGVAAIISRMPSKREAVDKATELLGDGLSEGCEVRIVDFTDRKAGRVTTKVIR